MIVFILNEASILKSYTENTFIGDVINQAGKQRMYSQKIAKLALLIENGDINTIQELQETLFVFSLTHESFIDENSYLSSFYFSNLNIKYNFDLLTEIKSKIEYAVKQIIENPKSDNKEHINTILSEERKFLVLMDSITNLIESASARSFYTSTVLGLIIGSLSFMGITFIIFIGLVPTINELRLRENNLIRTIHSKESLLAEIHHRIRNNLAVVSGIFQLQLISNEYNSSTFRKAIDRVQSIASIHEFLYHEEKYDSVRVDSYINELIKKLSSSYPQIGSKIQIQLTSDEIYLGVDKVVPFSLLLNELITNSLKHAFDGMNDGIIFMHLVQDKMGMIVFNYQDNGKGIEDHETKHNGIGMQLIDALSCQLAANIDLEFTPSFKISMTFAN